MPGPTTQSTNRLARFHDASRCCAGLLRRLSRNRRSCGGTGEGGRRHRDGGRGVLLRRGQPTRLPGRRDVDHRTRLRGAPHLFPYPIAVGDDRRGPRLRVQRAIPPRHRDVGPAGDRGVPRCPVRRAAGPYPRNGRHLPTGVAARTCAIRRRVLHDPAAPRAGHRAGQAAAVDQSPCPCPDSDHNRRAGAQERGAHRRDRRGLAAEFRLPREGRRGVG
jgi:hypothetical protein